MNDLNYSQFLNAFDITFLIICLISIFLGIKNGLLKSFFNLIKWVLIFFILKNCFALLRPVADQYITNETLSDVTIFLITLITSYIFISFLLRLFIGFLQPKKKGLVDMGLGGVLGIFRGYIVVVITLFFINQSISPSILDDFMNSGSFAEMVNIGIEFFGHIPRNLEEIGI
ncbi:CvpA family protein [Pelagibacteraceae bacterium]|nr:CvpA family protein [Pelagibacteraceae bacterium]